WRNGRAFFVAESTVRGVQVKERESAERLLDSLLFPEDKRAFVDLAALNAPRWNQAKGPFHEAWYLVASEPRQGLGLWVRYTADIDPRGEPVFAVWGSWFERDRTFALRKIVPAAAIGRSALSESASSG